MPYFKPSSSDDDVACYILRWSVSSCSASVQNRGLRDPLGRTWESAFQASS